MPGEIVELIAPDGLVELMTHIEPANVSIPCPAEIIRIHIVRFHGADGLGPDEETIAVVVRVAIIKAGKKAKLRGVTMLEKILAINIGGENILIAGVKSVQAGIGVLLPHVERDEIILVSVVVDVAKNSRARVDIVE